MKKQTAPKSSGDVARAAQLRNEMRGDPAPTKPPPREPTGVAADNREEFLAGGRIRQAPSVMGGADGQRSPRLPSSTSNVVITADREGDG